jgi:hypothetical protein
MMALVLAATPANAEVLNPALPQRSLPSGEAKAEAAKAYADAVTHYEADRLDAAITSAKLAYAMLPNASTAGLLCQLLQDKGDKRAAFEKCLVGLSLSPTGQEEGQLLAIMSELGRGVGMGWVDVKVAPEGAQVRVESEAFSGSRVIGLTPGQYEIVVSAEGHRDATETVSINAGIPYKVKVRLAEHAAALPPTGSAPGPKQAKRGANVTAIALMVAGGVIGLAGAGVQVAGALKISDAKDYQDPESEVSEGLSEDQRKAKYDDLNGTGETLQNVAGPITYGVGAAILVTGLVILLADSDDAPADGQATTVAPALVPGGAGLVIGGSF